MVMVADVFRLVMRESEDRNADVVPISIAAMHLGISAEWIRKALQQGKIRCIGRDDLGRRLVSKEEIKRRRAETGQTRKPWVQRKLVDGDPDWITRREAAEILGVKPDYLNTLARRKGLYRAWDERGVAYFRKSEILAYRSTRNGSGAA